MTSQSQPTTQLGQRWNTDKATTMDKLKSAVGMGGKSEEGQEPVSGAKGEGTSAEPFDAGNKQGRSHVPIVSHSRPY